MIKRNMKKLAPDALASRNRQAMLDAFGRYVRINPLEITEEKSEHVMVVFTGDNAELKVYEEDGVTDACGTQRGSEGKFMVFDSKHHFLVSGEDYLVVHFKEKT